LLQELDDQIVAARRQLQQLESARAALAGAEFVLGATRMGASDTGLRVIALSNRIRKLKRLKADKNEIATLEQERDVLREQLAKEKAERAARRRSA
jgi:hypothetical protein